MAENCDELLVEGDDFDGEHECWTCGGEGWGAREELNDWDPINEHPGEIISCPNCRGSGHARDCTYW